MLKNMKVVWKDYPMATSTKTKMDMRTLLRYEREGLVSSKKHTTYDLYLWNYSTSKVFFKKQWDDITLSCRTLVTDGNGNIVARSFPKFFNDNDMKELPSGPFRAFKKYDGSLIVVFTYRNELIVVSRASFVSEHAALAKQLIVKDSHPHFSPDIAYVFELIHPKTRIIVDYKDTKELVLLSSFEKNGTEHLDVRVPGYRNAEEIRVLPTDTVDILKKRNIPNEEGYVFVYENGLRVKVKFDRYKLLHKVGCHVDRKGVGEMYALGDGDMAKFVDAVPDEFLNAFVDLWNAYKKLDGDIQAAFLVEKAKCSVEGGIGEFARSVKTHRFSKTLIRLYQALPYKHGLVGYMPNDLSIAIRETTPT